MLIYGVRVDFYFVSILFFLRFSIVNMYYIYSLKNVIKNTQVVRLEFRVNIWSPRSCSAGMTASSDRRTLQVEQ